MPEIDILIDEGFGAITGSGSKPYTFDNWIDPTAGTSDTYTFESDDEGFGAITGSGCNEYVFQDPMDTGANC